MADQPKRPWWKLHWFAWAWVIVSALAFVTAQTTDGINGHCWPFGFEFVEFDFGWVIPLASITGSVLFGIASIHFSTSVVQKWAWIGPSPHFTIRHLFALILWVSVRIWIIQEGQGSEVSVWPAHVLGFVTENDLWQHLLLFEVDSLIAAVLQVAIFLACFGFVDFICDLLGRWKGKP